MNSLNWGNYPKFDNQTILPMQWKNTSPFIPLTKQKYLPHGNGRSYGDSCLNEAGILIDTTLLNHFISFDKLNGIIKCEAGVLLGDILSLIIPEGWILPVLPGTKFVTVGGAIANDVHGKNHHKVGTFGCHVTQFELLRSNGEKLLCSENENKDFYTATIGGLGLTGIILWAEIKLQPVKTAFLSIETVPFHGIDEFLKLSLESEKNYSYIVAWLDCQSKGKQFARGLFMRANFIEQSEKKIPQKKFLKFPFYLPSFSLNRLTISIFNHFYYHIGKHKKKQSVYYDSYFFPLDRILNWNKIYGKRGLLQYQFVLPYGKEDVLNEILRKITQSGLGSFLSVLKTFGNSHSPGILSFPTPGITLALDFPCNKKAFHLLKELDDIIMTNEGRVYPAKDARMSSEAFQQYFPKNKKFLTFIDPKFSSSFWRRVNTGV